MSKKVSIVLHADEIKYIACSAGEKFRRLHVEIDGVDLDDIEEVVIRECDPQSLLSQIDTEDIKKFLDENTDYTMIGKGRLQL